MTRNLPKVLAGLAVAGAMTVGTAAPTMAQGVYFDGPGISVGVGHPWYRHHHYYRGPYAEYRPYHHYWGYRHHYYRDRW